MEYSIQQLSNLAGVSTRTLRWYDKIGLLKPWRIADSGYRYYGPAEVDRLQDILYYRALGVELAQIRDSLDDPSFDRLSALRGHLSALEENQAKILGLIASVKETILSEERTERMSDDAKFQAFKHQQVKENEQKYGKEIREKYGSEEVDATNANMMGLTQRAYQEWEELGSEILSRLADAVSLQADPAGETGEALTRLHQRWLTITNRNCHGDQHKGIAQLYVCDERFQAYYDKVVPGCAQFLYDAVALWADHIN